MAEVDLLEPPGAVATLPEPTPRVVKRDLEQRSVEHRELRQDEFWRAIPAYASVAANEFHTHTFQNQNTVTNVRQLRDTLRALVPDSFYEDVIAGLKRAPMALRISPYLLSLIDWEDPYRDPIRTQFLPVASQQLPDHPELRLDSLHEQQDSPVPGLTHRYPDKALFLPLDSCPVYCRFCTRSYAIGGDTETVEKLKLAAHTAAVGRGVRLHRIAAGVRRHRDQRRRHLQFEGRTHSDDWRTLAATCRISGASATRPKAWPCCRRKF